MNIPTIIFYGSLICYFYNRIYIEDVLMTNLSFQTVVVIALLNLINRR
jgi:hypothetical protein